MAMTLASPSASPSPVDNKQQQASKNTNNLNDNAANNLNNADDGNNSNIKTESNATNNGTAPSVGGAATTNNNNTTTTNIKRKPSRRANTAERRATHNAVERQRRETLNGRFLDLAALLPNLSQIRRPSKSSIVNSSIAHVHASRRHRLLASRELRLLKTESDALRRELNEWRDRAGLPRVEEPPRSEAFGIIMSGELDVLVAEMGAEMAAQGHGNLVGTMGGMMDVEEEDDLDEWGPAGNGAGSQGGAQYGAGNSQYDEEVFVPQPPVHHHHHHHHQPQQHHAPPPPQHHHSVQHGGMGMMPMNGGYPSHHPNNAGNFYANGNGQPQQSFLDDERAFPGSMKNGGGNPFAHNVPRGAYDPPQTNGALFTPPATRDGLPPNGVAGLNTSGIPSSIAAMNNGGASPTHSVHSVHSAHGSASPSSSHSHTLQIGGGAGTPPPLSAVSTQFSNARSGSGSPSYELSSAVERRSSYPPSSNGAGVGFGEMGGYGMHNAAAAHHGGMGGHHGGHHGGIGGHHAGGMGGHGGHHGMVSTAAAGAGGGLFGMML